MSCLSPLSGPGPPIQPGTTHHVAGFLSPLLNREELEILIDAVFDEFQY